MNRWQSLLWRVTLFVSGSLFWTHLFAQVDLYPFPDLEDAKIKKVKEKKIVEPFVQALSKKMEVPEKVLTKTIAKGFGRTEIIRLILISKKSHQPLEQLIKKREEGERMAKISESAKLDNRTIRKEAIEILKEMEIEELKIKRNLTGSTTTTAGLSETVTKNGTDYQLFISTASQE